MNRPPPEKAPVTLTEHMDDGKSGEKNRNRNKEGNKNLTAVLQGPVVNNGQVFSDLKKIIDNITIACLVAGDFNDVANVVENKGGVLVSSSKCNIFMVQINMCFHPISLCLIHKVVRPQNIMQFRPISLCNVIYKIINKIVVDRLKPCIANIVSPFET